MRHCNMQLAFTVCRRNNDCEELGLKPKEKWVFVNKKVEAKKHRTEWCAAANKYECMRCGRSSKNMKKQGI